MTAGTVLVLPGGSATARSALLRVIEDLAVAADDLDRDEVVFVTAADGPPAAWSARVCAAIGELRPRPPLTVAAAGDGAVLVPAVGRAQRAAHRPVAQYVLVDPELPAVTDSWPDARVSVAVTAADDSITTTARLRGWTVLDA